jgi:hypothetical protein
VTHYIDFLFSGLEESLVAVFFTKNRKEVCVGYSTRFLPFSLVQFAFDEKPVYNQILGI